MASLIVPSGFGTFIAVVLWTLIAIVVFFAWYLPKNKVVKIVLPTTIAVSVLSWFFWGEYQRDKRISAEKAAYMAKYEPAKAIFDKLCAEQSQPTIKRVVEDVEGVLLLKVRREPSSKELELQMREGAGLHHMSGGDAYLLNYLIDRRYDEKFGVQIEGTLGAKTLRGFRYVDVRDEATGEFNRVTAKAVVIPGNVGNPDIQLERTPLKVKPTRYAIDIIDNVDPELRKHWIAGTTIRVTDTATNEILGEQTWWNWDTGFGNTSGSRSPWGTGRHCPASKSGYDAAHLFVDSVLKAKQGD
jgi:hypothetical protein